MRFCGNMTLDNANLDVNTNYGEINSPKDPCILYVGYSVILLFLGHAGPARLVSFTPCCLLLVVFAT